MNALTTAQVVRPASLADALLQLQVAAAHSAPLRPLAGCTDLLVDAHFGKPVDPNFLDLWPLRSELGGVRWTDAGLELGALCTYAASLADARLHAEAPVLAAAAQLVGATQIQARGTWAGNIENGSPAADGVPALMALDARVRLASVAGVREVPLDNYYAGYRRSVRQAHELITAIVIPHASLGRPGQWFRKVGTRAWQAITKVGLAGRFGWQDGRLLDVRIVAVSMAATVRRCPAMERVLAGASLETLDVAALAAAQQQDVRPIGDVRSDSRYRAEVFQRLVLDAIRQTAATQGAGR